MRHNLPGSMGRGNVKKKKGKGPNSRKAVRKAIDRAVRRARAARAAQAAQATSVPSYPPLARGELVIPRIPERPAGEFTSKEQVSERIRTAGRRIRSG